MSGEVEVIAQVRAVEESMASHALTAWSAANARLGLSDCDALMAHADALTRWSERLRMALRGALSGDEEWLRAPVDSTAAALAIAHAAAADTLARVRDEGAGS